MVNGAQVCSQMYKEFGVISNVNLNTEDAEIHDERNQVISNKICKKSK